MDREHVETALQAANVALSGRRQRAASAFASIELRSEDPKQSRWEVALAAAVGLLTVALVVGAWLY